MFATSRRTPSCEEAWTLTLRELVDRGVPLAAGRPSRELLGFDVVVDDVRQRLVANSARPLPVVSAVARFVWMMAGNDRLADIRFYEPNVARFTDDGLTVPGSNYGSRLRRSPAGTDQIRGAIERLKGADEEMAGPDGDLRRAANVIWRPEDAVRASKDIPCAFGAFYFPRDGRLVTQLVMRSNNAMALMPFNLFEFTLLAEVIAAEVGIEPGPFRLDAMSMHLYTADDVRATQVLDAAGGTAAHPMPPIQSDSGPLEQIRQLAQAEAQMRHELAAVAAASVDELRDRGEGLDDYWRAFLEVLLVHAAATVGRLDTARELAEVLPQWCRAGALAHLDRLAENPTVGEGRLFAVPGRSSRASEVRDALQDGGALRGEREHLHALLDEIERRGVTLTRHQSLEVERVLLDRVSAAARSDGGGGSGDRSLFSLEEVERVLRELGFDSSGPQ
ncbi:MAG: hypothetical protein JWO74_1576 [Solirubrobacterales bacterium]|nr:hypothetical protein [Solirubrobacterales bacterium]